MVLNLFAIIIFLFCTCEYVVCARSSSAPPTCTESSLPCSDEESVILKILVGDIISFWNTENGGAMLKILSNPASRELVIDYLKKKEPNKIRFFYEDSHTVLCKLICEKVLTEKPDLFINQAKRSLLCVAIASYLIFGGRWVKSMEAARKLVHDTIDKLKLERVERSFVSNGWSLDDESLQKALGQMLIWMIYATIKFEIRNFFITELYKSKSSGQRDAEIVKLEHEAFNISETYKKSKILL